MTQRGRFGPAPMLQVLEPSLADEYAQSEYRQRRNGNPESRPESPDANARARLSLEDDNRLATRPSAERKDGACAKPYERRRRECEEGEPDERNHRRGRAQIRTAE
ncbi:MAG: hypothetical protein ACK55O_14765 [Phycisphaerales bacterium]